MSNAMTQYLNIVPGLMPVDIATVASATAWVDLSTANEVSFFLMCGAMTSVTTTDTNTITVECATTNASGAEEAVAFKYRLSGAVTANTWAAVADATSAGYVPTVATLGGMMLWVDVDPGVCAAKNTDIRWVRLAITPGDCPINFVAAATFVNPKYHQATMVSAT